MASTKFVFTSRDLLYGKLRPYLRKIARPAFEGICSTDILLIRPGPDVDRGYLFHCLRQKRLVDLVSSRTTGANLPRIVPGKLAAIEIPLPPLPEQRRIAAMLDKADTIRRKREESLALLDDLLRSTFLEMFGDPVRNERGWEVVRLGEVADVQRGRFTPRPRNDPRYYGGDFPFIQTGDLARSGGLLRSWRQTLNAQGIAVSRGFPPRSIAVAIAANIGDTAIVDFAYHCPDSVVGVVPKEGAVTPEYLEHCLRFFKPSLAAAAPQTAQRNINLGVLRPLRVPVPPMDLQRRYTAIRQRIEGGTLPYVNGATEAFHLSRSLLEGCLGRVSLG